MTEITPNATTEYTRNTSQYVLDRRVDPSLRDKGDLDRLEKAQQKRERRNLKAYKQSKQDK